MRLLLIILVTYCCNTALGYELIPHKTSYCAGLLSALSNLNGGQKQVFEMLLWDEHNTCFYFAILRQS